MTGLMRRGTMVSGIKRFGLTAFFIIVLSPVIFAGSSKECERKKGEAVKLIENYFLNGFHIFEANPSFSGEIKVVENSFKKAVRVRNKLGEAERKKTLKELFTLFHGWSSSEYEDSPDVRRRLSCRSYILAAIALISEEYNSLTYLKMAKESGFRLESFDGITAKYKVESLMEDVYYQMLLTEFLITGETRYLTVYFKKNKLSGFKEFGKVNKKIEEYVKLCR